MCEFELGCTSELIFITLNLAHCLTRRTNTIRTRLSDAPHSEGSKVKMHGIIHLSAEV